MDHVQLDFNRRAARWAAILQIMCAGDAEEFPDLMWETVLGAIHELATAGSTVAAAIRDHYHAKRCGELAQ